MNDAEVDFPFRVSPSEQYIIENDPDPPSSIVLVGRSGTGKTTCAVFRMWARWLTFHHHSTEPFHQVWQCDCAHSFVVDQFDQQACFHTENTQQRHHLIEARGS